MLTTARREDGLSLIEVLIGMSTGLVVAAAAFSLLMMSMHLYSRTSERVDSAQRARLAMAAIVNELQSTCVSSGIYGVQSGGAVPKSDGNDLVFVAQSNSAVAPAPVLHDIVLSGGTLTDYSYTANSGAPAGPWGFPSTPTSKRVLTTNITQTGSTPVFQYFAYGSDYEIDDGTNGTKYLPLDYGSSLTAGDAAQTAEVIITFSAGPLHTDPTIKDAAANVTSAVVLRLTPNASGGAATPCQ